MSTFVRRGPQFTSWHISREIHPLPDPSRQRHLTWCDEAIHIGPRTRERAIEADGVTPLCRTCERNQQAALREAA